MVRLEFHPEVEEAGSRKRARACSSVENITIRHPILVQHRSSIHHTHPSPPPPSPSLSSSHTKKNGKTFWVKHRERDGQPTFNVSVCAGGRGGGGVTHSVACRGGSLDDWPHNNSLVRQGGGEQPPAVPCSRPNTTTRAEGLGSDTSVLYTICRRDPSFTPFLFIC